MEKDENLVNVVGVGVPASECVLHDIEGLEHEEIAEVMGISVGTSKSQLHKARARMRELLAPALSAERRYREETRKT